MAEQGGAGCGAPEGVVRGTVESPGGAGTTMVQGWGSYQGQVREKVKRRLTREPKGQARPARESGGGSGFGAVGDRHKGSAVTKGSETRWHGCRTMQVPDPRRKGDVDELLRANSPVQGSPMPLARAPLWYTGRKKKEHKGKSER